MHYGGDNGQTAWYRSDANVLTYPGNGSVTGTPTAPGTVDFTVQVIDSQSPPESSAKQLSLTVSQSQANPVAITTTSVPDARRNNNYSTTLSAGGGQPPYAWSIVSGSLPSGLNLNAAAGTISGKAHTVGTFSFAVQVRDSQSTASTDTQVLSIRVQK